MFLSVRSSKLYPRIRWCVSDARTVFPSLKHQRHCTLTPSQESRRLPSKSWAREKYFSIEEHSEKQTKEQKNSLAPSFCNKNLVFSWDWSQHNCSISVFNCGNLNTGRVSSQQYRSGWGVRTSGNLSSLQKPTVHR